MTFVLFILSVIPGLTRDLPVLSRGSRIKSGMTFVLFLQRFY